MDNTIVYSDDIIKAYKRSIWYQFPYFAFSVDRLISIYYWKNHRINDNIK